MRQALEYSDSLEWENTSLAKMNDLSNYVRTKHAKRFNQRNRNIREAKQEIVKLRPHIADAAKRNTGHEEEVVQYLSWVLVPVFVEVGVLSYDQRCPKYFSYLLEVLEQRRLPCKVGGGTLFYW